MDMIISVKDALRNEGERFDFSFVPDVAPINYMGNVVFKNVSVDGSYFADGENVRFLGKIELTCVFECDRCLNEFQKNFSFSFNELYSASNDEEEFRIQKNETVDFQPLLNDTILSNLPIERLCKEDCKGLCPQCGIDKNFSSCSCEEVERDNPFAVLKGLVD